MLYVFHMPLRCLLAEFALKVCGATGIKVGGTQVDIGECQVLTCPGNSEDYCGAENRIYVFETAD